MNNSKGRSHVLGHCEGINIIAHSLSTENIKTKVPKQQMQTHGGVARVTFICAVELFPGLEAQQYLHFFVGINH